MESSEGSESDAVGDLGIHRWQSIYELRAWSFGDAVLSADSWLARHSHFDYRHCSAYFCRERFSPEG